MNGERPVSGTESLTFPNPRRSVSHTFAAAPDTKPCAKNVVNIQGFNPVRPAYDTTEHEDHRDHHKPYLGSRIRTTSLAYAHNRMMVQMPHVIHRLYAGEKRSCGAIVPPREELHPAQGRKLDPRFPPGGGSRSRDTAEGGLGRLGRVTNLYDFQVLSSGFGVNLAWPRMR